MMSDRIKRKQKAINSFKVYLKVRKKIQGYDKSDTSRNRQWQCGAYLAECKNEIEKKEQHIRIAITRGAARDITI